MTATDPTYYVTCSFESGAWDDDSPVGRHIARLDNDLRRQGEKLNGMRLRILGNMKLIDELKQQIAAFEQRKGAEHGV